MSKEHQDIEGEILTDAESQKFEEIVFEFERLKDKSLPLSYRIKAFLRGERKAGRTAGMILDVILLPFGRIQTARELAQRVIKRKNTPIMQSKKWYQSKTIWSAILILLLAVLQALGLDFVTNPEVMDQVWGVAYALAGALGLVGLRDAIDKQRKDD